MKHAPLALVLALGCSAPQAPAPAPSATAATPSATTPAPSATTPAGARADLHCTPSAADAEATCTAKGDGCHLGAPLECYGTPPPKDVVDARRRALAEGSLPCACVCPEDMKRCYETP